MNQAQRDWLLATASAAVTAQHIYARMAACEAALESNYGQSALAREANNLFGMKQHVHPTYGTLVLPTKEFLSGEWVAIDASFVKYATVSECFADRMDTLKRLRTIYPHYMAALLAQSSEDYVREVSRTWSTDPARAEKCIAIFNEAFAAPALAANETVQDATTGEN